MNELTDLELSTKVAELNGWKMFCQEAIDGDWETKDMWITAPDGTSQLKCDIPLYCTDENTIHKLLRDTKSFSSHKFIFILSQIIGADMSERSYADFMLFVNATPRQLCEAFVLAQEKD